MSARRCLGNTNRLRIRERDRKTSQTDLTSPMSPWRDRRRRPGKIFLTGAQKWRLTESHRGGTSLKSQRRMWDPAWGQKVHIGSSRSSSAGEKVPSGPAWDVQCPVKRARHTGMEALLRLLPPSGCSCKRFFSSSLLWTRRGGGGGGSPPRRRSPALLQASWHLQTQVDEISDYFYALI